MFARFKNFVYRHRRKFIVSGVIVGGAIFAINYAHRKILEWQEKEAKEFLKKAKKDQHFRSTERTCNQTIFSLSKALKETIFRTLDSDAILQKIREGDGDRVQLWEELKIVVFAQTCTLLYAGLMLVLLLRVQLNIIGGYMLRDESPETLSPASQEKYLSLCQHFLEKSVTDLCSIMKKHAKSVLEGVSLKQKLTLKDIENIFWRLESSLNGAQDSPLINLPCYLIPETNGNLDEFNIRNIRNIVLETSEILKHREIVAIAESSLKRGFSNTVDKISEYYVVPEDVGKPKIGLKEGEVKIVNITEVTVPLAKIVPILHGLYKTKTDNGIPDPWIEQFVVMDSLNSLGANIYEAYTCDDDAV